MISYRAITISGRAAVGTSTLAKHLKDVLGWKYINAGQLQREYDQKHKVNENMHGALLRSDKHEQEIDDKTKEMLRTRKNIIYEGWLAGYMAQGIPGILKVLVICLNDEIRAQRVSNRDHTSFDEAANWIKQREAENLQKWKKLYGKDDFWEEDSGYYDLILDSERSDSLELVERVVNKLGFKA